MTTTDHALVETRAAARSRRSRTTADALLETILGRNLSEVLTATPDDTRMALRIGDLFSDQDFSMVDRTVWAVMERHGIEEAVAFDADFAVCRYGPACEEPSPCIVESQTTRADSRPD